MGHPTAHKLKLGLLLVSPLLLTLLAAACGEGPMDNKIRIDGSSTVFPITEAVVEEYARAQPSARITVGVSGTGGGFQKFCRRELDLTNASRPITDDEGQDCQSQGINYLALTVAFDGLVVVVHPSNTWVKSLKVSELKKMWEPSAQHRITRWNQIRPDWPDAEIHLFGAGTASGTYDYFTQAVVGRRHASRGDYTASEDDNVLVQGISTDPLALGFFGFAYYEANQAALRLVPIDDEQADNSDGPIIPTVETVKSNSYAPLSRPLLVYVSSVAARRPEVQAFIHFYLSQAPHLAREVGYIPLPASEYRREQTRFDEFVTQQR